MNTIRRFLLRFWIIGMTVLTFGQASAQTPAAWTTLFDGRSTDAWRGFRTPSFPTNCWVVDKGTLKTVPGHELDLVTKEKYQDFELELEWRVAVGANSGIMYHVSEDAEETWQTGPEMQVVDDDNTDDGKDPLTSAGSLYDLVAPKNKKMHPAGQWNQVKLTVKGPHVEHWLNGVKIVQYDLGSPELNALIAKTKFKDMPRFGKNATGFIVLQNHGGEVWFRNIRARKL